MYYQSKSEIEEHIRQAGEQAVFEANCGEFHEEIVKLLGRLHYRTSYGQNVLKHTLEVVHLAGIMAAELGANVKVAEARRRCCTTSARRSRTRSRGRTRRSRPSTRRRYGESPAVVHAVEAHHYEVQPQTVEAVLLIAADAISGSRPGARGDSLENYVKRLEALEELAAQKHRASRRSTRSRRAARSASSSSPARSTTTRPCCSPTRSPATSRTTSSTRARSR